MASYETATFGGGCFWCLEPLFDRLKGVHEVRVGFAGGSTPDPSYRLVCTGRTGHAEVVQVTFDPDEITYEDLLEVFFAVHDPTTLNRQGADVGSQYRSIILIHSEDQKKKALAAIQALAPEAGWEGTGVTTEVAPLEAFYSAEGEHHKYFEQNPHRSYCRIVIAPKVKKFQKRFAERITP